MQPLSFFYRLGKVIKVNDNYCSVTQTTSAVCIWLKPTHLKNKEKKAGAQMSEYNLHRDCELQAPSNSTDSGWTSLINSFLNQSNSNQTCTD